jgi:hypothetical protein
MTHDEIKKILDSHSRFLQSKEDGTRADLRYADLHGADLHGADLHGADLHGADLRGADLRDANLRYADLCHADLRNADLRHANLRHADLCHANFPHGVGAWHGLKWNIYIVYDQLSIGCETHSIEEWKNFTDDEIDGMDPRALRFWKQWKVAILTWAEAVNNTNSPEENQS